ncbi:hypothetical protein LTR02_006119 [Friedmanniomyces endolithicus]|nr:hypothetical protein LTR94_008779 [Friedmanniomyces endolithicus]KAK0785935.1 hypothetical protein LTR59_010849 [Friedmanniomyces endolithicus]KAK0790582.1 hypothetical protein LTR38_010517 [Friedmanniomyces endolithicus]KAK0801589.1 hypothetical protein LTR75_008568 [Friedmanniomyces endolithicus]KAK0851129.1 hypothetical protein LTR03_004196 [Friedmanniomyces endolithicus]
MSSVLVESGDADCQWQGEEQYGNPATGNMQSGGEGEGLDKVYEYTDDDDGHTVMTGYDRPEGIANRAPPSHHLTREYRPPLSDIDERSEAGSQAAPLPTHNDAGSPDTALPDVAAVEAKTQQFWNDQEHDRLAGDLNKALRLSKREAKAKLSHHAAHKAELAQAVRESVLDLEYRAYLDAVDLDKATQQSLKDQAEADHREHREREDLQRAEDFSLRDAEAAVRRGEDMKRKLEAETLRAKEESIDTATAWKASRGWVQDEEVVDGNGDVNDDASTVMTGTTWRSARSQRATAGHVDDASDAGSIASSSRATARQSPPAASPPAAAAGSSSHHHTASARAQARPHWTRSNDPQYPPSRPPTYTTLPRTYPTDPNPQIPAPPLRSPSPVATIRGVLANSTAEEEKRRATHSRRFEREEAGEEGSVSPAAPPITPGQAGKGKFRFPTPSKSDDDGEADGGEESEGGSGENGTSTVLGGGASMSRSLRSSERGGVGGAAKSV